MTRRSVRGKPSRIVSGRSKELAAAGVGDGLNAGTARWSFAGDVSRKFDTHVERSVPLYNEGHRLTVGLSDFFLEDRSRCYELGCSTGALIAQLAEHHHERDISFIGIDVEPGMVEVAQERCAGLDCVEIVEGDVTHIELAPADFIVAYYTLQFVRPKHRQVVFNKIFQALHWGGAFLMFEKVRAPDARFQDIAVQLYNEYKIDAGYSPAEISGKARSLKGVLEPFSTQGNLDLLHRAGFKDVMTVMKSVCFEGFLAIK